jgi:hypothetical protein
MRRIATQPEYKMLAMTSNGPLNTGSPLTIGRILKDLEPGQLWKVVTALVTITAGAFTLGYRLAHIARVPPVDAIPCSAVANWPAGTWITWGRISDWKAENWKDREFPQVVPDALILSNISGTVTPRQRSSSKGVGIAREVRVQFDPPLRPGGPFNAVARDGTPEYESRSKGTVSADGCRIEGTFIDTNGTIGTVNYLFKRDRYYVDR